MEEKIAYTVRPAAADDLERLAEIKVRNWTDTYGPLISPEALRPFLDQASQVAYLGHALDRTDVILIVAEEPDGEVIGFSLAYLDESPDPWLESLHVDPHRQGRGVGTLLMQATAREIRSRGLDAMRLGVVEGNLAAERLYERLGGIREGSEPVSWAEGVRHHIFRWPDLERLL